MQSDEVEDTTSDNSKTLDYPRLGAAVHHL